MLKIKIIPNEIKKSAKLKSGKYLNVDKWSITQPYKILSKIFENMPAKSKIKPIFSEIVDIFRNFIMKKINIKAKMSQNFWYGRFIPKEIPWLHKKNPPLVRIFILRNWSAKTVAQKSKEKYKFWLIKEFFTLNEEKVDKLAIQTFFGGWISPKSFYGNFFSTIFTISIATVFNSGKSLIYFFQLFF